MCDGAKGRVEKCYIYGNEYVGGEIRDDGSDPTVVDCECVRGRGMELGRMG